MMRFFCRFEKYLKFLIIPNVDFLLIWNPRAKRVDSLFWYNFIIANSIMKTLISKRWKKTFALDWTVSQVVQTDMKFLLLIFENSF